MQIIGFGFTKITAFKLENFTRNTTNINTTMEFINVTKEEIKLLKDNNEGLKLNFKLSIDYTLQHSDKKQDKQDKQGEISFEGYLVISVSKEESKNIQKSYKKKHMSPVLLTPLYNFLLRKCAPKAMDLEDEIGLPLHIPIDQIKPKFE